MFLALNLILTKKQKFGDCNSVECYFIEWTYKWEKSDKQIITTFITLIMWLLKKIADYNNINSVNHLYLMINEMIGHVEEKNENKYLVLDDIDENKEVLKKYEEVWEGIKK